MPCSISCAAGAKSGGVRGSSITILSLPKDASLPLLFLFRLLRRQKNKARRPKTIPAAAMLPTVTPAICGLVRTGWDAGAAAAVAVEDDWELIGTDVIGSIVDMAESDVVDSARVSSVVEGILEVVLDGVDNTLVSMTKSEGDGTSWVVEGEIEGNDGSVSVASLDIVLVERSE